MQLYFIKMGLSDILQKALAAIAVVAFIFDVIAIGTGKFDLCYLNNMLPLSLLLRHSFWSIS